MRFKNACLTFLLVIAFSSQSYAKENIEPFGTLAWKDGLDTVVQKLSKMGNKITIRLASKSHPVSNSSVQPLLQLHHARLEKNFLSQFPD